MARPLRGSWIIVAALVVDLAWATAQSTAQDSLPSETLLPVPADLEFPSENLLPGVVALRFPDEHLLPQLASRESPSPDRGPAGQLEQEAEEPAARVWLRLAFPGHTSPVRALTFTRDPRRLWSAGEDKEAHVWLARPDQRQWLHERVARWDVARSADAGRVYALAASPQSIAMGGSRAYGGRGDIVLFHPQSGARQAMLAEHENEGHLEAIVSLAFSPNGQRLASTDVSGRVVVWFRHPQSGNWTPRIVPNKDRIEAPPESHDFFPVAWRDDLQLLVPTLIQVDETRQLLWNIEQIGIPAQQDNEPPNMNALTREPLPGAEQLRTHLKRVTSMAVADQGRRVYSSDARGQVFLWDLSSGRLRRERPGRVVASLAASKDGGRLLAGMDHMGASPGAAEIWEVPANYWDAPTVARVAVLHHLPVQSSVRACAIADDGRCAAADQSTVYIGDIQFEAGPDASPSWTAHAPRLNRVTEVAFEKAAPADQASYVIGLRHAGGWMAFDTRELRLVDRGEATDGHWTARADHRGDWDLISKPDQQQEFWLQRAGQRVAKLPWSGTTHQPDAWCWIPDADGQPWAVAVNYRSDGVIHVLRLTESGTAPVRRFRGHQSKLISLSVSPDRRYLVSAGADALIGVWPIEGLLESDASTHRWGCRWEERDGKLHAVDVQPAGPAFHRGVRDGDQLISLTWSVPGETGLRKAEAPAEMLAALNQADRELMPAFSFVRGHAPLEAFHMYSSWDALAWLFVSADREWAYWTPRGYYDASFNGNKLFGWQVNRDRRESPEFYLADQFRARLERPALMSRLLSEGSLDSAWKATQELEAAAPPADVNDLALNQPQIEFLEPRENQQVDGEFIGVRVVFRTRAGQRLATPKAFANGVLAGPPKLVEKRRLAADGPFREEHEFVWRAGLPNDSNIHLQVVAATDSESAVVAHRRLIRGEYARRRKPKIMLVSAGVNQYQDPQIPSLDFAAMNADAFERTLGQGSRPLYQVRNVLLRNAEVTRPMWRVFAQQLAEEVRDDVTPDDMLVFFLSGHGVRDEDTDRYYYVGANASFSDIQGGRYQDCLSFSDFSLFADLPCRKLVILDTCHSGAVQTLRQRNLKAALRALQDDLVLTLTASEGHELAFEERGTGMGRFTRRLLRGLEGEGDEDGDGVVTLNEAARYVAATVPLDNTAGPPQHPTFGPLELLDVAEIPLTKVAK